MQSSDTEYIHVVVHPQHPPQDFFICPNHFTYKALTPYFPLAASWLSPFFVTMNLTVLAISLNRLYTVFAILWQILPFSMRSSGFICVGVYVSFLPFSGWMIFQWMCVLPFVTHSSTDGHLGCSSLWVVMHKTVMNIDVQASIWVLPLLLSTYPESTKFLVDY